MSWIITFIDDALDHTVFVVYNLIQIITLREVN